MPERIELKRAIFLDRDGVINRNRPDNVKALDEFEFEPSALAALAQLAASAWALVVVSNQAGIARGHMTAARVDEIHAHMLAAIRKAGGRIDRIYYCPHLPEASCPCRKPAPGMLYQARDELGLDLSRSFFVGDWVDDVRAAGAEPILVRTGRGTKALAEIERQDIPLPVVVQDLGQAVEWVLANAPLPIPEPKPSET